MRCARADRRAAAIHPDGKVGEKRFLLAERGDALLREGRIGRNREPSAYPAAGSDRKP
jgi:hypothetical protein